MIDCLGRRYKPSLEPRGLYEEPMCSCSGILRHILRPGTVGPLAARVGTVAAGVATLTSSVALRRAYSGVQELAHGWPATCGPFMGIQVSSLQATCNRKHQRGPGEAAVGSEEAYLWRLDGDPPYSPAPCHQWLACRRLVSTVDTCLQRPTGGLLTLCIGMGVAT